MWLVDLDGSEHLAKTEIEGGKVHQQITLCTRGCYSWPPSKIPASHIDGNSKPTHLLQISLGGDCKKLVFVEIHLSSMDSGESLCSLNSRGMWQVICSKYIKPYISVLVLEKATSVCSTCVLICSRICKVIWISSCKVKYSFPGANRLFCLLYYFEISGD